MGSLRPPPPTPATRAGSSSSGNSGNSDNSDNSITLDGDEIALSHPANATLDPAPEATAPAVSERSLSPTRKCFWHKPTAVNVYTTCGRHTDQFLFGGRSIPDLARTMLHRERDKAGMS